MSFASLNREVTELRHALRVYVGAEALGEVGLKHPTNSNDEAAFLRLTSWCYALLFETGRVVVPFFLKLPGKNGAADKSLHKTLRVVHSLRTFASHNLGLSEHDMAVSRQARDWLRQRCGTDSPKGKKEWALCFKDLCLEVTKVVVHCHGAVDAVLGGPIDGASAVEELKRRLERNWPRQRLVTILGDVVVRMEVRLNIDAFVNNHLSRWRDYQEYLHVEDDTESHITRVIERDVLNHLDGILPIDGRDVLAMGIPQGPAVGRALLKAKELMRMGHKDRGELLRILNADPEQRAP